jgi:hypothetical protein
MNVDNREQHIANNENVLILIFLILQCVDLVVMIERRTERCWRRKFSTVRRHFAALCDVTRNFNFGFGAHAFEKPKICLS